MKNFTLLFTVLLLGLASLGQTPAGINYQAVARSTDGNPIPNQDISVKISILSGSPSGTIVYGERHNVITSNLGLFTLQIGKPDSLLFGTFIAINWGAAEYFLKIEIDEDGGHNFIHMGTSQLLSVPYALYSENTANPEDADADPENEIQTISRNENLVNLSHGGGSFMVGMESYSQAEIDALSPYNGLTVHNSTTNCINYYFGNAWFEMCGDCTPLPSQANAGQDQVDITDPSAILEGNIPEFGEGLWSIVSGEGGSFADANDPVTTFSGQPDIMYNLQWQIYTPCDTTYDTVAVSFYAEPQVFEVGEEYEGGIIAYILQPGDPGYVEGSINGFIAAPNDMDYTSEYQWGCYGVGITGADGTAIGTGYQNTLDIVTGCAENSIAARLCNDLVLGGFNDWYLPSKDELNKVIENRNIIGGFEPGGMYEYADYWSSSESDISSAWSEAFDGNWTNQYTRSKGHAKRVRAIRSFSYTDTISPESPSNPNPENEATNQELAPTLSWTCTSPVGNPLTYDVYLGTENPPALLASGISQTIYVTDTLEPATQYFWKIVAHDDQGHSTEGDIWNFTTAQTLENLEIGDEFLGGVIAYILQAGDPGYVEGIAKGLIAAPNDHATNVTWGCSGTSIGTSTELGSGAANTTAIIAGCSQDGIAARICDEFALNGYDDWYLPSKEELNKLYLNKDLIGGFSSESYWCSSESSNIRAYKQAFSSGGFSAYLKTFDYYVRPVRSFSYSGVYAPETPSNPNPEDGAVDQIHEPELSWTCSDPQGDELNYDIYFGTEATPPLVVSGQSETTFSPDSLNQYTQYFWKIIAHDDQGNTSESEVWNFTTLVVNLPPDVPSNPLPENGAHDQELSLSLSWTCADYDNDSLSYDIYLGVEDDLQLLVSGITDNSYTTNALQQYTWYFWKIVAHDSYGNTTEGETWSFRTIQTEISIEVGAPFEGGIIAYILQPGDPGFDETTTKGFIAAEADQSDGEEWGCYFEAISGADGTALGTGLQNTLDIVTGCTENNIAASICNDLVLNGFDDWFLPSIDELAKLHENQGNIGGFVDDDYWSSSELNWMPEEFAYTLDFGGSANSDFSGKYSDCRVRAIRSFSYTGSTSLSSPSNPTPEDGSENRPIACVLSWNCPVPIGSSLIFDIYFGAESIPPLVTTNYLTTTYNTDTLEVNTQYFWKIVAHDDQGNSSESEVWNFTTAEANTWQCGLPFVDFRDGQIYETVQIDDQCWMAENLAYLPAVSPSSQGSNSAPYYYVHSYQGSSVSLATSNDNFHNYGVLYNWLASYDACPEGWSLPSNTEWETLTEYLGGANVAGGKIKSPSTEPDPHPRWDSPNIGATNSSGFSGLPGGGRNNATFEDIGVHGFWWTSTENSTADAWYRYAGNSSTILYGNSFSKGAGFSVRCLTNIDPQNQAPEQPSNPDPENGAINQELAPAISWTCSSPVGNSLTYDVYLGTENPPALLISGLTQNGFYADTLNYNTQYFWKVVAHDNQGNSTEGDIWSFTTMDLSPGFTCGDSFLDIRDGQSYESVQIGNQCWMAENLNIGERVDGSVEMTDNGTLEKYCYEDIQDNCNTYGGMYQWNEIMEYSTDENSQGICPEGWFLPSDSVWIELFNFLGGQEAAGGKMKEVGIEHWWEPNTGATNNSGFTALPGGGRYTPQNYYEKGSHGMFWSSTEAFASSANVGILLYYDSQIGYGYDDKTRGFSVRCVKSSEK